MSKQVPKPGENPDKGGEFTEDRREGYFAELREHGETAIARHNVGVSRPTVCKYRKNDPDFAEAEAEALAYYKGLLGKEFDRRGHKGIERAIYYKGREVAREIQYSDKLLVEHGRRHGILDNTPAAQVTVNTGGAGLAELMADLDEEDQAVVEALLKKAIAKKKAAAQDRETENDENDAP